MIAEAVDRNKDNPNDPRNREVLRPPDDLFDANLKTPINSSGFTMALINSLPAYRRGITPFRRGLEVGMAHGYWLLGPFVTFNPLRNTDVTNIVGLLSTIGLLVISTILISLYGYSEPPAPTSTLTTPRPPAELASSEGWNEYGSGFLIGGIGGAIFAYFLLANFDAIRALLNG